MNQYEWMASSPQERQEAIDGEIDACNRKDSTTFDVPPIKREARTSFVCEVPKVDRFGPVVKAKHWWQKLLD
ncbi:MAG: hypothetical protein V3S54_01975 [Woeseiaceae bacterium]